MTFSHRFSTCKRSIQWRSTLEIGYDSSVANDLVLIAGVRHE
jgi:hypothetical protein